MHDSFKELDAKELDFADIVFSRDIENPVFQAIVAKCLSSIEGVGFVEGNLLDTLLGREEGGRVKGITIEQDQKNHSVNIRVEVNIAYGISIPEKAEEIQSAITTAIIQFTGLHVGSVHVVFKNLISDEPRTPVKESEPVATVEDESDY
jgi:uncharacterized alkaline shock family protein YloU